jgi:hypothetical protein
VDVLAIQTITDLIARSFAMRLQTALMPVCAIQWARVIARTVITAINVNTNNVLPVQCTAHATTVQVFVSARRIITALRATLSATPTSRAIIMGLVIMSREVVTAKLIGLG